MSDFMPRDMLPDLWDEILKRHWTYLDTDGSIQKIEEGKKLENCLKEFLCIVPHDRKFFLPETAHVLRKSIREMDEFNAYKAIIGFRSISHYANNLFTKPWRKEFRVLKMYSGFYQHEIKSNLLDAEKLFEAMGYRQVSEEILVLDGPICPDQVTNVSRDAMAAYVECQIMEHIYSGLIALGITCSWQDIFHYREKYIGGSSQAIKSLGYAIQERQMRKEKLINIDNCYASIQHSPQTYTTPECANCSIYNRIPAGAQYGVQSENHGNCAIHAPVSSSVTNNLCNGNSKMPSYPISGYQLPHQVGYGMSSAAMQHSRSLDHYSEPVPQLPHRHSFDHQQKGCTAHHYKPPHQLPTQNVYEHPYDCLDGASMGESSVSYAAVVASGGGSNNAMNNCGMNPAYSHPYNVSGNRYPLPYNISNQLNTHYATPNAACNGIKSDPYNNTDNGGYASVSKSHNYQQPPLPPIRQSSVVVGGKDFQAYRQRSFPPDQQLIEFDDRAPLKSHDFHALLHRLPHCNSFDYDRERIIDQQRHFGRVANIPTAYAQTKDIMIGHQYAPYSASQHPSSDDMYGNYAYARPLPKADRLKNNSSTNIATKQERNSMMDVLDNNDKHLQLQHTELKDNTAPLNGTSGSSCKRKMSSHTNEASDLSFESNFDDFSTVGRSEQRSPTQASKNQDGVGSYESWNYVFQNLERAGYSKDLNERGDLLVQGLNLDSMNLSNGGGGSNSGSKNNVERRRSNQAESTKVGRYSNNEQNKAPLVEKSGATPPWREVEKRDEKKSVGGFNKQEKSILKPQPVKKTKSGLKQTPNLSTTTAYDNNNGNNEIQSEKNIRSKTRKQSAVVMLNPQLAASGQSEWSCRFCTFLNPDTERICEMCCRSKDLNLEAAVSHTPTCV
ncbi:protein tamozhennic [Bactrocera dorsalis]|uniref:Protein tamozhennic n=1 Tax=Bactrocera dorsalis TaxID=27457 RepID=A0A6I9VFF7_BACDO|nr:protein tamozhennic [Bactrocera dorsalis]XP_011202069.2 protein tamozhennic [Bactrocera dorsalis]XP_011202070.2 protein tamozhennic [Bactrocera dorsalis]XP_011202071.2 protein tamozhennic [Bactrocera dorsalis]XP_011202073.2 protein tamozhennic [Bactrocera dorsalis]XP_011202074.2 protein tamozhennic [Bactrocera dorsalis]XP_011202075.2 protein tamozhennic [Bactrocera dorsalis]XP_011202078.2 protein tamozhennic [Bactrocera dorsalis]